MPNSSRSAKAIWVSIKWMLLAAVCFGIGKYVAHYWQAILEVDSPHFGWLSLASAIAILPLSIAPLILQLLLAAHGNRISYRVAVGLLYVPLLGKYVPGKVWSFIIGIRVYGGQSISSSVAASCMLMFMGINVLSAGLVGTLIATLSQSQLGTLWPIFAIAGFTAVGSSPSVFYPLLNYLLRLLGRSPVETRLTNRSLVKLLTFSVLFQISYGVSFIFIVHSLCSIRWHHAPYLVGLFALAQIVGLVAFFAPAGIGVREGALVAGLTPIVGPGPAIVISAMSRLWQTILELMMAAAGWKFLATTRSKAYSAEAGSVNSY